ncbi:glucose-1-phosphate thymidylyltransferase [Lewinellaceae bacterium SD302]|nr:glucose-1-phosphate thymidylyltransferase [Lewinellaceae bacterium SD302]
MTAPSHIVLFDSDCREHLLPLTYTRPVAALRVGILTIKEKYEQLLPTLPVSYLTQDHLSKLFPILYGERNLLINGNILPDRDFINWATSIELGTAYVREGELVATHLDQEAILGLLDGGEFGNIEVREFREEGISRIERPADIFRQNDAAIRSDFTLLTAGRESQPLSASNTLIGSTDQLFIEEGANIEAATLNVKSGPIYIGKDAVVLEGCLMRGPISIGAGSALKMGAKIYGATTLGPQCKVGGEVNNVVFQANSNKSHDGYLGNAVIGQWCNIGADTNASNLKNDYSEVRVWSYPEGRFARTGLQFHGLVMGDHSKAGINTMFNTGSVIGVSANIFGEGFPRTFIPSFSWGGSNGFQTYRLDKALATIERVMARRDKVLSEDEREMLTHVFEESAEYRPK